MILATIVTDPRERTRFLRFAVVGLIGAVVDFGTYTLLHDVIGVMAVLASVCSFLAAVVSNFTWNRYWTYPDSRTKQVSHQVMQFAVVSAVGLSIRTPIFAVLEKPLRQFFLRLPAVPLLPRAFLGDKVALAVAVIVVMFWNFFINRYWTYGDVE
ncbi:MAG TPA: GtrA family protein [Anaerolineales bacterium]|nr:GtrA family protein [Anaerolineales bacterium]